MTPIKNMGPKSRVWLHDIGINTLEDLEAIGAVEAYRQLKASRPTEVTLNALLPDMKADLA